MMDDRYVWEPGDLKLVPPKKKSLREEWRIAREQAQKLLWDPSKHPRVPAGSSDGGQFGEGGGGMGGAALKFEDFEAAGISTGPFKQDEHQKQRLIEQWNTNVKMPPAQFKKEFLGGMDGTMTLQSMVLKPTKTEGGSSWLGVKGHLQDKDGKPLGEYTRTFQFEKKEAETNRLYLNDGETGKGIGKKMLAANVAMFQKLGIEKVRTSTDSVGGYAWAKYGYVPNNLLEFSQGSGIYDRIDDIKDEDDRKWMTAIVEHEDPRAIWIMADSKYGKKLLVDLSWDGVLDLKDEKSMARFNAYVGRK
jgi:GNAT superfamily N-acetyltransferase